jgi:hypothetical protein
MEEVTPRSFPDAVVVHRGYTGFIPYCRRRRLGWRSPCRSKGTPLNRFEKFDWIGLEAARIWELYPSG